MVLSLIQMDYTYPWGAEGLKVLTMVEVRTGYAAALCVQTQGSQNTYAVQAVSQFLNEAGEANCVLQTDMESGAIDVARAAAAKHHRGRVGVASCTTCLTPEQWSRGEVEPHNSRNGAHLGCRLRGELRCEVEQRCSDHAMACMARRCFGTSR